MRIRLKGINSITKKLADGTRRTYWYAWKGGPPKTSGVVRVACLSAPMTGVR